MADKPAKPKGTVLKKYASPQNGSPSALYEGKHWVRIGVKPLPGGAGKVMVVMRGAGVLSIERHYMRGEKEAVDFWGNIDCDNLSLLITGLAPVAQDLNYPIVETDKCFQVKHSGRGVVLWELFTGIWPTPVDTPTGCVCICGEIPADFVPHLLPLLIDGAKRLGVYNG